MRARGKILPPEDAVRAALMKLLCEVVTLAAQVGVTRHSTAAAWEKPVGVRAGLEPKAPGRPLSSLTDVTKFLLQNLWE